MTPTVDDRPKRSDGKPLYIKVFCKGCREGGEHWAKLTGRHQWSCQDCGAVFWWNPWVSDGHELIRAPIYDKGDELCKPVQPVEELDLSPAHIAVGELGTATNQNADTAIVRLKLTAPTAMEPEKLQTHSRPVASRDRVMRQALLL